MRVRLARYIAMSACRISVLARPPEPRATPMLAPVRATPSTLASGAASRAQIVWASRTGASVCSPTLSRTANSSPPSRARVVRPPSRGSSTTVRRRCPTSTRAASPALCPCASLRSLKLSRSMMSSASSWPSRETSACSRSSSSRRFGRPVRASDSAARWAARCARFCSDSDDRAWRRSRSLSSATAMTAPIWVTKRSSSSSSAGGSSRDTPSTATTRPRTRSGTSSRLTMPKRAAYCLVGGLHDRQPLGQLGRSEPHGRPGAPDVRQDALGVAVRGAR